MLSNRLVMPVKEGREYREFFMLWLDKNAP